MAGAAEKIVAWTVDAGLKGHGHADLVSGYCDRLIEAGLPLWRAAVGADRLHPLIDAQSHRLVAGDGVVEEVVLRAGAPEQQEEDWLRSPWYRLLEDREPSMRRRLATGEGTNEFPLLGGLAAQGGTDYLARMVEFSKPGTLGEGRGLISSWTTRASGGFTDRDIALINETLPAFALSFKAVLGVDTARTLVTTYLGRDPAERVLRGEIERGGVETVRRVLWFSDLTDFTRIADTLAREQLLDLLNAYADCLVGVIQDHGGEVLKFVGDGMLAVFSGGQTDACRRALDAAETGRRAIAQLNWQRSLAGRPVTDFTLALHEGEVLYGNIGSRDRLDFTVVGPAVNEVSRIQALSRSLDQPVLVSSAFAAASGDQRRRLVSVGRYALRGVHRPQELFTLEVHDRALADL